MAWAVVMRLREPLTAAVRQPETDRQRSEVLISNGYQECSSPAFRLVFDCTRAARASASQHAMQRTTPLHDWLRRCSTDGPVLHLAVLYNLTVYFRLRHRPSCIAYGIL